MFVLDVMLPGMDGLSIIETLREEQVRTPVLVLSALGGVDDRVRGLRAGGDDYLVKPFAFAELLARVDALARRSPAVMKETLLRVGDLEMDLLARTVRRKGREIELLPKEFQLLAYLTRHAGQVIPRAMLLLRSQIAFPGQPHRPRRDNRNPQPPSQLRLMRSQDGACNLCELS